MPETVIVTLTEAEQQSFWDVYEGGAYNKSAFQNAISMIKHAAESFGYPCFLRTDFTSHKHDWERTCFLDGTKVVDNVMRLFEFSEMADFVGLPTDVWVVRELLKTKALFTAFHGRMPITREFRLFVRDGVIEHSQPYWPAEAIEDHKPSVTDWREKLFYASCRFDDELERLTLKVSAAVPGFWSVDWLQVGDEWYMTDMAEGDQSYRWDWNVKGDIEKSQELLKRYGAPR